MKLLDKYVIRHLLTIVFFAILVFTLSWLAPEIMFKAIQGVSLGIMTPDQGFEFLLCKIPEVLIYCLPISMFFGSVFFFRQLSLSAELTAIMASGISFKRILLPVAAVGLVVSFAYFATQEVLVPMAAKAMRELNQKTHFDKDFVHNPQVTFVEKNDQGVMDKFLVIMPKAGQDQNRFVFLFYKGSGDNLRIARILTANNGVWNDNRDVWELKNGVEYLLNNEGIYQDVRRFTKTDVKTSAVPQALLSFPTGNPSEFRVKQLEQYVRLLSRGGQTEDARFYRVRLYQRYLLLWVPLLFSVLGAGVGIERSRAKRNLGLTYAAVLLLFYNIMVPSFTTLGSIGILPSFIAALLPLVLAGIFGWGVIRLRRAEG